MPSQKPTGNQSAADHSVGPRDIEGVEASDLPGKGRGSVETDYGKEARRKTPDHTGGVTGGDTGMRAMPDSAEADDHGHRKHN